jgi:hypothetical protein
MKSRLLVLITLTVIVTIFFLPNTTDHALGADGTTGNLEVGTTTYVIGQPIVFYCSDLTAEGDYKLDFPAGVATDISWTQGIGQTVMSFTVELSAPTTGDTATIELEKQSAGTVIDSVMLSATDYDEVFPDELVIGIAITILVISILVGIAVSMRYRKK